MRFSGQDCRNGLPFFSPVDHVLSIWGCRKNNNNNNNNGVDFSVFVSDAITVSFFALLNGIGVAEMILVKDSISHVSTWDWGIGVLWLPFLSLVPGMLIHWGRETWFSSSKILMSWSLSFLYFWFFFPQQPRGICSSLAERKEIKANCFTVLLVNIFTL